MSLTRFFVFTISCIIESSFAQGALSEIKNLSLNEALNMSYKSSPEVRQAQMDLEIAKMNWEIKQRSLTLPTLSLVSNISNHSTLYQVPGSEATSSSDPHQKRDTGFPSTSVGIGISEYRLFNSWLDTIDLRIAEIAYDRAKMNYSLIKKNQRYKIIGAYFNMYQIRRQEEIARKDLQLAKAVSRLTRAQSRLKKNHNLDLEFVELEVANSERRLTQSMRDSQQSWYQFQIALGVELSDSIQLTTEPLYFELDKKPQDYEKIFENMGEVYQIAKMTTENDKYEEERSLREQFPITVSLSAISWLNNYEYHQYRSSIDTQSIPEGNVNLNFTIAIQFPIWGENGFLNADKVKLKTMNRKRNEEALRMARLNGVMNIRSLFQQIQIYKEELSTSKSALFKSTQLLTKKMESYSHGQGEINRLELRDLLTNTRISEIEYYQKLTGYIQQVISLSQIVGQDLTERFIN